MLGTRADAEDIAQEAFVRWRQANVEELRSAAAWLVSVVTRLSIDRRRKASVEREQYTGLWLMLIFASFESPDLALRVPNLHS